MTFSLLDSPFAVLGLSASASLREIRDRAGEIDSPAAESAERMLVASLRRLEAELVFLPGAKPSLVRRVLDSLRAERLPDLQGLSLPAKANVLAHLAARSTVDPDILRQLTDIHGQLTKQTITELVSADRTTAGMPTPNDDLIARNFGTWTDEHATVLVAGARSLGEKAGANALVELINDTSGDASRRRAFLRNAAMNWGRTTAAQVTQIEEAAKQTETRLSTKPAPEAATNLAAAIHTWARLTGPERAIDAADALTHDASVKIAGRWHALACDLANEKGAVQEALTIARALADEFGSLPGLGTRIQEGLATCEKLAAAARERNAPEIKALEAAIAAADMAHSILDNALDGGPIPLRDGEGVVARLAAAFAAASVAATGARPWLVVRTFALGLHNDADLTGPALSLTLMMLVAARAPEAKGKVGDDLLRQLEVDAKLLRRENVTQKLSAAIKANRLRQAIALVDRLLSFADEPSQRQSLNATRKTIVGRLWARRVKIGLGFAFIGFLVWAVAQNESEHGGAVAVPTEAPVTSSKAIIQPLSNAPAVSTSKPPVFVSPTQPSPGGTDLTRAELLWCLDESHVLDAAEAQLNHLRGQYPAQELDAAATRFSTLAANYQSACSGKRYWDGDKQAIQAQLDASAAGLRKRGQEMIMGAIGAAAVVEQPPAPQPAPSAPASPNGATNTPAQAFARDLGNPQLATWVQERLAADGFDPGPADGLFGPRSRAALKAFKQSRGIAPADDSMDEQTMQALTK